MNNNDGCEILEVETNIYFNGFGLDFANHLFKLQF